MSYTGIKEILLKGNQKPFLKRSSQGRESRISYNFLSEGQRIRFLFYAVENLRILNMNSFNII